MTAAYPLTIRTILRASKARSQPPSFSMAEPRRGTGYVQEVGTDTPVFWNVMFRFTRAEALVFQVWFTSIINRGVDAFTMPIRTEFGVLTHTCQFLPDSLLDATENGESIDYKATIMARKQLIPTGYAEAASLIVTLPNWTNWAQLLDRAVNVEMPT